MPYFINWLRCMLYAYLLLSFEGFSKEIVTSFPFKKSGVIGNQNEIHFQLEKQQTAFITVEQLGGDLNIVVLDSATTTPQVRLKIGTHTKHHNFLPELAFVDDQICQSCLLRIEPFSKIDQSGKYELSISIRERPSLHKNDLYQKLNQASQAWLSAYERQDSYLSYLRESKSIYQNVANLSAKNQLDRWQELSLYRLSQLQHLLNDQDQQATLNKLLNLPTLYDAKIKFLIAYDVAEMHLGRAKLNEAEHIIINSLNDPEVASYPRIKAHLKSLHASIFMRQSSNANALELYRQANPTLIALNDWPMYIQNLISMGWLEDKLGNLLQATNYYQQALAIALRVDAASFVSDINVKLATIYRRQGDYNEADFHIENALSQIDETLAKTTLLNHNLVAGWAKQERARIYHQLGQLKLAEDYYIAAKQEYKEYGAESDQFNIDYFLIQLFQQQGEFAKAKLYAENVLNYDRQSGNDAYILSSLIQLADIERLQDNHNKAVALYKESLSVKNVDNVYHLRKLHSAIATSYCALEQVELCERHFQRAEQLIKKSGDLEGLIDNTLLFAEAKYRLGEAQVALNKLSALFEIVKTKLNAIDKNSSKSAFQATQQKYADLYLDVLAEQTKNPLELLEISEQLRSQALLSLLNLNTHPAKRVRINTDLNSKQMLLDELHQRVINFHQLIEPQQREAVVMRVRKLAMELEAIEARRINKINPPIPAVAATNFSELKANLSKHQLILYFDLGNQQSHVWAISKNNTNHYRIASKQIIDNQTQHLLMQLKTANTPRHLIQSGIDQLSSTLLSRLNIPWHNYSELIIVPDGALLALPFSLLLSPTDKTPLLDSFSVSYMPSLTTFNLLKNKTNRERKATKALVLADPAIIEGSSYPQIIQTTRGIPLNRLPYARNEAKQIAKLLSSDSTILLGENASKRALNSLSLSEFELLHFATHAVSNNLHPLLNGLVLSNINPRENVFLAPEISQLRLNAGLVVLSGCETSYGPVVNGEGTYSLSRAFLEAGVENIISSHWKVQDDVTSILMEKFYLLWLKQNRPIRNALQEAKQYVKKYQRKSGLAPWRHPYYWAGFTLQGTGELNYAE